MVAAMHLKVIVAQCVCALRMAALSPGSRCKMVIGFVKSISRFNKPKCDASRGIPVPSRLANPTPMLLFVYPLRFSLVRYLSNHTDRKGAMKMPTAPSGPGIHQQVADFNSNSWARSVMPCTFKPVCRCSPVRYSYAEGIFIQSNYVSGQRNPFTTSSNLY